MPIPHALSALTARGLRHTAHIWGAARSIAPHRWCTSRIARLVRCTPYAVAQAAFRATTQPMRRPRRARPCTRAPRRGSRWHGWRKRTTSSGGRCGCGPESHLPRLGTESHLPRLGTESHLLWLGPEARNIPTRHRVPVAHGFACGTVSRAARDPARHRKARQARPFGSVGSCARGHACSPLPEGSRRSGPVAVMAARRPRPPCRLNGFVRLTAFEEPLAQWLSSDTVIRPAARLNEARHPFLSALPALALAS